MDVRWIEPTRRHWQSLTGGGVATQQDHAYGAACAGLGARVLRAEITDAGTTVAAAQIVHRRLMGFLDCAICTRGPVWREPVDDARKATALRALYRALPLGRLCAFFVTPESGEAETPLLKRAGMARVMTPYTTATLDLTQGRDALRAAMHRKWRNRLVAAEKAGIRVMRAGRNPAAYAWLLDAEAAQQRTRRYAALPPGLVPAWAEAGGNVLMLKATRDGATLAAMLFLIHGSRATYHIGWSRTGGPRHSAGNLLMWSAMTRLARLGVTELDLGGLNTRDTPGIARFKLGAGARVKTLCGTWFGR